MRPGATRARFRERQVLRAADLEAEQSYLVGMRRRHNVGAHGWGVVRGLGLVVEGGGLYVEPGMAVDGYGRELFVAERLALPPRAFDELASAELDVWLVYERGEEVAAPRGRFDCGHGRGNRWRARSRLRLTAARRSDPRAPAQVPDADLDFAPHRDAPDDPAREWPVFLGTFARGPAGLTTSHTYTAADDARPYATLVGGSVDAPSGRARMQVAEELAGQTQRFAVSVPDAAGKPVERLALDREGRATLRGHATLGRRLRVRQSPKEGEQDESPAVADYCAAARQVSAEDAAHAIIFRRLAATPAAAAPWQVYRTSLPKDGRTAEQLRFELAHPGDKGDPKAHSLAIGTFNPARAFHPCLTVSADCRVTVAQDLHVLGRVVEGAVKPDITDPRFTDELRTQWEKGRAVAEDPGGEVTSDLQVTIIVVGPAPPALVPQPDNLPQRRSNVSVTVGDKLAFTVKLSNVGRSTITNVKLHGSITHSGRARSFVSGPITLGRGMDVYFPAPGQPPLIIDQLNSAGTVTVSAAATGVGPLANVVKDADAVTVSVVGNTPAADPSLAAEIVVLGSELRPVPAPLPPAVKEGVARFPFEELYFAVRVTKTGPGTVTDVRVSAEARFRPFNSVVEEVTQLTSPPPATLAGAAEGVSVPPAGATPFIYAGARVQGGLSIHVTVTGVAPSSAALSATDILNVNVQPPIT